MAVSDLVLHEADHQRLAAVLDRLRQDANAKSRLPDRQERPAARVPPGHFEGLDPTSLAALTGGKRRRHRRLGQALWASRSSRPCSTRASTTAFTSTSSRGRAILVVIFDEHSSLGLVRLRVKKVHRRACARSSTTSRRAIADATLLGAREPRSVRRDHGRRHRRPLQQLTGTADTSQP